MEPDSLKILVVGGCHTNGYLVGEQHSFVSVFSTRLHDKSICHEISAVAYMNLSYLEKLSTLCSSIQPDLLIIQENYCFTPSLISKVKKRFLRRFDNNRSSGATSPVPEKSSLRSNNNATSIIREYVCHLANSVILYRYLNASSLARKVEAFFQTAKRAGVKNVLVISPTPTENRVMDRYRSIGGRILEQKTKEAGFGYLDVQRLIKKQFKGKPFTLDKMHLNKDAHTLIGHSLSDYVFRHYSPVKHSKFHQTNDKILHCANVSILG